MQPLLKAQGYKGKRIVKDGFSIQKRAPTHLHDGFRLFPFLGPVFRQLLDPRLVLMELLGNFHGVS